MRRKHVILFIVFMFITWNMLMYYTLVTRAPATKNPRGDVNVKLNTLQSQIELQLRENEKLLDDLRKFRDDAEKKHAPSNAVVAQVPNKTKKPNDTVLPSNQLKFGNPDNIVLPLLMISCNRKAAVTRSMDLVLKYRKDPKRFPVIVSQDCGDKGTADTIQTYVQGNTGVSHIKQPDLKKIDLPWPQKKFEGYYNIARHYKWALDQVFLKFNHSAVIIIEDDLDISPDFFEYFSATYRILSQDASLWCVSAWNDNGKQGMVKEDPELLHRTDFFPGLGWMMEKKLWLEIGPKWPKTFWDDWMRHQDQRKERSCIRPELGRTSTFGKVGVSKGLFYDKHLKFIRLNDKHVNFTQKDLSYLLKDKFDPVFKEHVYSLPEVSITDVMAKKHSDLTEVRVTYTTKNSFKDIAKKLLIMDDFKAGVERTAYMGVVQIEHNGQRVYVAPPSGWTGYDTTWT